MGKFGIFRYFSKNFVIVIRIRIRNTAFPRLKIEDSRIVIHTKTLKTLRYISPRKLKLKTTGRYPGTNYKICPRVFYDFLKFVWIKICSYAGLSGSALISHIRSLVCTENWHQAIKESNNIPVLVFWLKVLIFVFEER